MRECPRGCANLLFVSESAILQMRITPLTYAMARMAYAVAYDRRTS